MSDDNLSNEILAFIEGNHSVNDFSSSPLSDTSATSKKPTTKSEHTESSKRSKKSKPKKNVYSKSSDSEALDDEESWSDVPEESDRFPPPFSDQFKNSLDSSKETTFPPPPIQLEDDDDDAYEDKWDSDLMGGESDREYLQSLPELEREKILNERAEKRQMVLERKALKKKLRESGLAVFEDSTKRANRSKSEKRQKLEALKGQREEKRRKHESAPSQTRPMHRSAPFSNIEAVHDVNDELVQSPLSTSGSQESTFDFTLDHLRKLQVTRHQIKNWCFASFFEKSVIGAFVRINVGDHNGECIYRVAQIKDIQKYKRTYKIDNLVTNKALVLAHGKAVREFLADIVSNQPITEEEFNRWRKICTMEGVALPSQQHQEQKLQDLQAAHAYVFSEHDVDEMLELKQQLLGNAPRHLAAEKAKLVKQREIYLSAEQYSKAKEIESQLLILKQSTMEEDMKRQQASKRFTTTTNIAGVNRRPFYVHEEKKVSDMLPNPKDLLQEIDEAEYPENIESFQDLMSSVRWDLDFDL